MKTFGQAGVGVFVVPTAIAKKVANQFHVNIIGSTTEIHEQFYAIAAEQRLTNSALIPITEEAKELLKQQ